MYHSDKPIEQFEDDLLGRESFARQLADSILSIDLTDCFAISICGKWGTGKTSVLNMMQKEIEAKAINEDGSPKAIVMRFEPWNFSTCDQLLTQFFAQMSEIVSKDHKNKALQKIGDALEHYSSGFELLELIPKVGPVLKIVPGLAAVVGRKMKDAAEADSRSLLNRKKAVVDALKEQSCRIVVVIDDIDRLSNEQIRLVFQLVSSVAGFPNVVYVLSFDKDIVARALQTVQMDNGLEYLEKVIQVPFELPEAEKDKITDAFVSRLNDLLEQYPEVQVNTEYFSSVFLSCVSPYISTLRDVNRIINALSLKLALVKDEVNFADLTAITVLQTMQPWIFEWIRHNKTTLVGTLNLAEAFALGGKKNKRSKESYIQEFSEKCGKDAESVFYALVTLFPKLGSETNAYYTYASDDELRTEKRIAHVEKFDLYFSLSLEKISITSALINTAINHYSEEEFSELLLELNDEQKASDFLMELKSRAPQVSQERIPVLVRSLLKNACRLTGKRSIAIAFLHAHDLAVIDVELLLAAIKEQSDRTALLLDFLQDCSADCLISFADVLNSMEISHGRLAANGNKRGEIIVDLDSLEQIEKAFMDRASVLFGKSEENMLINPHARIFCYLWSCFDREEYVKKLEQLFIAPENVCRYIAMFTSNPTVIVGSQERTWNFADEYGEFISDEKISDTLKTMLDNRSFYSMDGELQMTMAAYTVWVSLGKKGMEDRITETAVNKQMEEWRNSYPVSQEEEHNSGK